MSVFDEEVSLSSGSPLMSKRYVLKIVELEASEHPQYGPGVRWIMHVLDVDGGNVIIRDSNGEPYAYWATTGTRISAPKPGQKVSKAYRYACAFLGREIQVGESGSAIATELIGKKAEAFLAPGDTGNLTIMAIDKLGTNYPQFRTAALNGKAAAPPSPVFVPSTPDPEPVEELAF